MAYVAPIKKSDKRIGLAISILFLIIMFIVLIFVNLEQVDPPFPQEEVVMIMDFSDAGNGSSGGSEEKAEESSPTETEEVEEISEVEENTTTQVEESPVTKPKTSSSKSETKTESESNSQKPAMDFGSLFGGSGNGEDGGDGSGKGDGGDGIGEGPGNVGGGGIGDGSSRKVQFKPDLNNLTDIPAKVAVKIKIDNTGKVFWAEAQTTDNYTNTSNKKILELAVKKAKEFKYKPTSGSTKYDMMTIKLNFIVS